MCAHLPLKPGYGEEHGILLLTSAAAAAAAAAGLHSHSHTWLLLKVLLRSFFSLILALSLVFYLVYNYQHEDYSITHHQNGGHLINQLQSRDTIIKQQHLHGYYSSKHLENGDYAISQHQSGENPQEDEDHIIIPHLKGDCCINVHQNGDHFINPDQSLDRFSGNLHDQFIDQHQNVDATYDHVLAPQKVKMMNLQTGLSAHDRAASSSHTKSRRKLQMARRSKVNIFLKIFQDLLDEGLLKMHHKVLCIGARAGEEMIALKKRGLKDVVGINLRARSEPNKRSTFKQHFADESFDFTFTKVFDDIPYPAIFVAEIERTLKSGGFAAMHVSLNVWRNRFMSSEPGHGIKPVTLLFQRSEIVYVSTAYAPGLDTIIVFKKNTLVKTSGTGLADVNNKQLLHYASIPQPVVNQLEPLLTKGCRKCMEEHLASIRYIPNLWDLDKHNHHVYVSVGAHDFDHSWFEKQYPKNGHKFSVFAIDTSDSAQTTAGITLSQNAAWIRNESDVIVKALSSGQSDYHDRAGVTNKDGDIVFLTLQGLDFTAWLKRTVMPDDFVVVKIDVKGMEFERISRMLEMGTIYLIDELFLVCDHDVNEVKALYERPFTDCFTMYEILRSNGVAVHQWW